MGARTKIVATLGPASREFETIRRLVEAGVDCFRINFSHGKYDEHQQALSTIRSVEGELNRPVAVLADLCGPKIRVGAIAGGSVQLVEGSSLTIQRDPCEGTAERISTTLPEIVDAVRVGETLLLDDGKLRLEVCQTHAPEYCVCKVIRGGPLSGGKGINLPQTALKVAALTEKDRADAQWIAQRDFDYVALSFVRSGQDIVQLRELLVAAGSGAQIVAKIEKPQALERLDEIIAAADALMVARGDLGVEMDLPAVPVAQKRIVSLCQGAGKPCIVATQMLESMISCATPTRAEVSDVANAVLDHADAVMLSGETAVGKFPVETVDMMNRVVTAIEDWHDDSQCHCPVAVGAPRTPAALAAAVRAILAVDDIAAVAIFTNTGTTARLFSKIRLGRPILAMSPELSVVRRMCLYYGVAAVRQSDPPEHTRDVLTLAEKTVLEQGLARSGQKIIVISGRPIAQAGKTNTLVVHTVE